MLRSSIIKGPCEKIYRPRLIRYRTNFLSIRSEGRLDNLHLQFVPFLLQNTARKVFEAFLNQSSLLVCSFLMGVSSKFTVLISPSEDWIFARILRYSKRSTSVLCGFGSAIQTPNRTGRPLNSIVATGRLSGSTISCPRINPI